MQLDGKVAVITGAARGIGAALAHRFAAEGAAGICVSDLDGDALAAVAAEINAGGGNAIAVTADVTVEAEVRALVAATEERLGPIDLFCSNAGVAIGRGLDAADADWAAAWAVNMMAHVYAARAVVPGMLDRGRGYLLQTCSAAGVLNSPGDAPYAASKHAAVAFAEWLSITYGDAGIGVSALCPLGVGTRLLQDGIAAGHSGAAFVAASGPLLKPEQVADAVVEGLAAERFLILPHPEVAQFMQRKASDPDRWLAGMRRSVAHLNPSE